MRRLLVLVVGLWLAGGVVLGGILLMPHLVALRVPDTGAAVLREQVIRELPLDGRWHAVHVLYRSCPCSRRTFEHLLTSPRPAGLVELVLLVDDDGSPRPDDQRLRDAGYRVRVIAPAQLARSFDLQAVPVLVIARPDGALAYVGGYTRHKQGADFQDLDILASLRKDDAASALPVFGCPTSQRLARALDPLGLRRP